MPTLSAFSSLATTPTGIGMNWWMSRASSKFGSVGTSIRRNSTASRCSSVSTSGRLRPQSGVRSGWWRLREKGWEVAAHTERCLCVEYHLAGHVWFS